MEIAKFCRILLLCFCSAQIQAQTICPTVSEHIGCLSNGFATLQGAEATLFQGFNGGFNAPQIQKVDGAYFVLDGTGGILQLDSHNFAPLEGLPNAVAYKFIQSTQNLILQVESAQLKWFRKSGTLYEEKNLVQENGLAIVAEVGSVFDVADMDCDGKIDLVLGKSDGTLQFYKGILTHLTADTLQFALPQNGFAGIQLLGTSCNIGKGKDELVKRHGSSAITVIDFDNDGDKDVFWGDTFTGGVLKLVNSGTCQNPQFMQPLSDADYVNFYFPSTFKSTGLNKTEFLDIDNDGDLDMSISVLGGFCSDTQNGLINNLFFYKNNNGNYTESPNPFKGLDVGKRSVPAILDFDKDGDDDLVVGTESQPPNDYGKLLLYENTGGNYGFFTLKDANWLNVQGLFSLSPVFADLDADGNPELIIGDQTGKLRYFKHNGTGYDTPISNWLFVDVGLEAAPTFVDIDQDADLDLFIGNSQGKIWFYRNIGTATAGDWQYVTNFWNDWDVGSSAHPTFVQYENKLYIVIGREENSLLYASQEAGTFTQLKPMHYWYGKEKSTTKGFPKYATPIASKIITPVITKTDDFSFIFGGEGGGLRIYKIAPTSIATTEEHPIDIHHLSTYPNPFVHDLVLDFSLTSAQKIEISLFDILGRLIKNISSEYVNAGLHQKRIDLKDMPNGNYLLHVKSEAGSSVKIVIKNNDDQ